MKALGLLVYILIFLVATFADAEVLNIRSASSVIPYKPYIYGVNVNADVNGDWMIIANATLTESNAFVLKRNNITFNYDLVYVYPFETNAVATNGQWFAVSGSNGTNIFQLDNDFTKIQDSLLPTAAAFVHLQRNNLLVLVDSDSIDSYALNGGDWQLVNSLAISTASTVRYVNFLEDKLVICWNPQNSDQFFRFYQRNETAWNQIDEFKVSQMGTTRLLTWNGNDTLLVYNSIMVKSNGQWTIQSYFSSSALYSYNAAFIDETHFVTNEFRQNNSATIFARDNSTIWAPSSLVLDNLQRPNVASLFQYLIGGENVVVLSIDASGSITKVLIDEIAPRCTSDNTAINCDIQLDSCQNVTISSYFSINRPCALEIDPKPLPLHFDKVFGTISIGLLNFSTSDGFQFSCNSVIHCPLPSNNNPDVPSSSTSPSSAPMLIPVVRAPSASTSSADVIKNVGTITMVIAIILYGV